MGGSISKAVGGVTKKIGGGLQSGFGSAMDFISDTPESADQQSTNTSTSLLLDNLFSQEQGQNFGNQAAGLAQQGLNPGLLGQLSNLHGQTPDNPFASQLQSSLLNPNFGGLSASQQSIVDQAMSGRQAQFNNLGIGSSPAAQTAIAAAAAGPLAQFQLQQNQQLQGASDSAQQFGLQEQGQDINSILAQLGLGLQSQSQGANTLLSLAGLGAPQIGQHSEGQSTGTSVGATASPLSSITGAIGDVKGAFK